MIKFGLILIFIFFFLYHLIFPLTKNIYCFYLPENKINKAIFKNPPPPPPLGGGLLMQAHREWKMILMWLEEMMTGRRGGFATAHGPQPQLQPLLGPLGTL